ncbi:type IV secretory system conjugative DNA transfer family protein [Kineococcus glutinatus]|uniref:type IV secretory system conjugative DNA transfer family protein n=1 Tax=Kineococcus glutinatus TaxID=1070872 RepID=UPI0031EEE348
MLSCLRQWAADSRSPRLVLETRADRAGVRYLLGAPPAAINEAATTLRQLLGTTVLNPAAVERPAVQTVGRLAASTRHRPLRLEVPELIVAALLAALTRAGKDEGLVLQLVLGPRRIPLAVPTTSPSSVVAPWWSVAWRGDGGRLDSDKRSALRTKVAEHGFACTLRLGVRAGSSERRRTLLLGLLAALRTSEAAGVQLSLHPERAGRLDAAERPFRWPLRLGIAELLPLTAWPLGDADLPGQPALHPKPLPPPAGTAGKKRVIARALAPGVAAHLALDARAALQHLHVVGPTGVGKSTLLANLICQDIADGRAAVVVEPKGDLVAEVLARVPRSRRDDIVVLDPADDSPVGLNPLAAHGRRPELVADGLLAVFKQLYGRAIGPRSQDILYAGLLTLAHQPDASLAMLPLLLTNPGLRRRLTAGLHDPLTLEPFWSTFEAWSDAERATAIAPVMNKLRPLLRPGLRGVIGQRRPRFQLRQVLTERKVLLVPLQRGVIGPEAAGLLGSLLLAELWQALQGRGAIPAEHRHPVMVYVDEVQDYLHLPTDLGEALAQARGYGAGFTLAHQFLGQLPREMRAAVLANARSRVAFQLSPEDATALSKGHPELTPADLTALGPYQVYASLLSGGRASAYALGQSLPLGPALSDPAELRARSRERFGQPLAAVDADFAALAAADEAPLGATGRRRRQP